MQHCCWCGLGAATHISCLHGDLLDMVSPSFTIPGVYPCEQSKAASTREFSQLSYACMWLRMALPYLCSSLQPLYYMFMRTQKAEMGPAKVRMLTKWTTHDHAQT